MRSNEPCMPTRRRGRRKSRSIGRILARDAAFAAAKNLMDRLKHEVPVFKREALRDGAGTRWVGSLPGRAPAP